MNDVEQFERLGYIVCRQMFSKAEVEHLKAHYMALRLNTYEGDFAGVPIASATAEDKPDPLQKYPRLIHMHRWDKTSLDWLLDDRLRKFMTYLLGTEPYAVQTMLYFKPPGARGQALHQDNYYLRVQPGTCMAAWMALDDCDEANGCMQVVAGSHTWPILCTVDADSAQSFTDVTVELPPDTSPDPVTMQAGDVLFFNGSLVHGSFPNTTSDRFRRALIGHYIVGEAQRIGAFYQPVLRMDGSVVQLENSPNSTECGVWVDREGHKVIEMAVIDARRGREHE